MVPVRQKSLKSLRNHFGKGNLLKKILISCHIGFGANGPKSKGSNLSMTRAYWPITCERMVRLRSVKSLQNRLDQGYLLMTENKKLSCGKFQSWADRIGI